MDFFRKVKSRQLPTEAILWIIMAPLLLIIVFLFGFGFLLLVPIGLVYGITNLVLYIQSRNWGYLILMIFFFLVSAFAVTLTFHRGIPDSITFFFGISCVISLGFVIWMGMNRNLKWWSYEVLEIAARPVEDVREGYTNRPLPVGKIEFNKQEMARFVRFIRRHLIAVPYLESDKVVFLITHSRFSLMTADRNYADDTYICFHSNGNVTANISFEDYQKYKETFAFDQLCEHLGKLFISYYQKLREGQKEEILESLKTMHQL
jgi:hypothetical protein